MGVRSRIRGAWRHLLSPRAGDAALDDRYFVQEGNTAASGLTVTAETSLRIGTVYRCIALHGNAFAMLPANVVRTTALGRERIPDHPALQAIARKPNPYQTPFTFRRLMMGHVLLRGNAYARIVPGPGGPQLWPLHPDRVTGPELLPDGRLRYEYSVPGKPPELLLGNLDVLHVHGLSSDGLRGLALSTVARDTFGLSQALEQHGSKLFSQGVRLSGVLKKTTPGELKDTTRDRIEKSFAAAYGGITGAHRTPLLEDGLEFQQIGMQSDQAQFLESRRFSVAEIARWFGIPPHMVGDVERSTSWGSGIEQQQMAYVMFGLMPWCVLWEEALADAFISEPDVAVKFNLSALLRAEVKTRFEVYSIAIGNGIYSPNECRELEDMNPREGGNEFLTPLNMRQGQGAPGTTPPPPNPKKGPPPQDDQEEDDQGDKPAKGMDDRAALVHAQAARLVTVEEHALVSEAKKHAANAEAWEAGIRSFYGRHAHSVCAAFALPLETAKGYCREQSDAVVELGLAGIGEEWWASSVTRLAGLASIRGGATC